MIWIEYQSSLCCRSCVRREGVSNQKTRTLDVAIPDQLKSLETNVELADKSDGLRWSALLRNLELFSLIPTRTKVY